MVSEATEHNKIALITREIRGPITSFLHVSSFGHNESHFRPIKFNEHVLHGVDKDSDMIAA